MRPKMYIKLISRKIQLIFSFIKKKIFENQFKWILKQKMNGFFGRFMTFKTF